MDFFLFIFPRGQRLSLVSRLISLISFEKCSAIIFLLFLLQDLSSLLVIFLYMVDLFIVFFYQLFSIFLENFLFCFVFSAWVFVFSSDLTSGPLIQLCLSISFLQHGYFKSVLRATISGVIGGFCCFYWFSFTLSCLLLCLVTFCCVWDIVFFKIICKNILKPEMMLRSSR